MELHRLDVARLPGIDDSFSLEFAPGLNLVVGANGSGKSSVCRAVLHLIFPVERADPGHDVSAVFRQDGHEYTAVRAGTAETVWQPRRPLLPPPSAAHAYHLGLLDLHKADADRNDRRLARQIRARMAGGYDPVAVAATAPFKLPGRRSAQASQVREAEAAVRELREELEKVATAEDRLPRLAKDLEAAGRARRRLVALDLADRLADARDEVAARRRALATHPPEMARLRGDERESLTRLDRIVSTDTAARDDAGRRIEQADRVIADAELPDELTPAVALAEARQHLQAASRATDRLRDLAEQTEAAAVLVTERARALAPESAPSGPISREAIAAAEDLLRRHLETVAHDQSLASVLSRQEIQDLPDAGDELETREAMRHLVSWLAVGDKGNTSWRSFWPFLVGGAGLLAAGLVGRPWTGDLFGWSFAAGGLVLVAAGIVLAVRTPAEIIARRSAERAFTLTGTTAPVDWSRPEVHVRLNELATEIAASRDTDRRRRWRDELTGERQRLGEILDDLRTERADLARRYGAAPGEDLVDLVEFLRRVASHGEAMQELAAAEGRVAARTAERDRELATVSRLIAEQGLPAPADTIAAAAALDDLENRVAQRRDAERERAHLIRNRDDAARRLETSRTESREMFRRVGLSETARGDLERLLDGREAYLEDLEAARAADRLLAVVEEEVAGLGDRRRDVEELARLDPETRKAERETAHLAADRADELNRTRGGIERDVERVQNDTRLQDALARLDRAREVWRRERDRARQNALAQFLLKRIAEDHATSTLPAILQRAADLFARFTGGGTTVRVVKDDAGDDTFAAVDTTTGRPVPLVALSDGTRAQLLLAARLAFASGAENDRPLPLLLDQALTAADPQRFAAVGRALLQLVREEKRQVIVLTASPATVAAWQELLRESGGEPAPVVDLDAIRGRARAVTAGRIVAPDLPDVPDPTDRPPADYAREIDVPALDIQRDARAAHLFYLLGNDLPTLHRLLRAGPRTWGAVTALTGALAEEGILPADRHRNLAARAGALTAFLAARRIGRGRPTRREDLHRCDPVARSSKSAEIEALLVEMGGEAAALMAALRAGKIERLNRRLVTSLEEFLREEGYLDPDPTLGRAEVEARTFGAIAAEVAARVVSAAEIGGLFTTWWRATEPVTRPS